MVKQKSYSRHNLNINEYKTPKSHGELKTNYQENSLKSKQVQVVQSSGCCCSSKKSENISQPIIIRTPTPPQQTAHERTHERLDSNDPFYHYYGRINKKQNRMKKKFPQQYSKNRIHSIQQTNYINNNNSYPVQTTPKKNSSCCTIL